MKNEVTIVSSQQLQGLKLGIALLVMIQEGAPCVLTKKRIVDPKVTTCSAPFPFTHVPFSDYNLNQEQSVFGVKERKGPLIPT